MTASKLSIAESYAKRGWHVFPCKERGKTPLTKDGFKSATTDLGKIREWWTKRPEANIAIATGKVSGIVVIIFIGQGDRAVLSG